MKWKLEKQWNKKHMERIGWVIFFLLLVLKGAVAEAAPVLLENDSALVYESTNENSSPVGSLIRGNSFELMEAVEAADGSLWYRAELTNGMTGYIKGDVLVKREETAIAEEEATGELESVNAAEKTTGELEAAETATAGGEAEPETAEKDEIAGETKTMPEDEEAAMDMTDLRLSVDNRKSKTYAVQGNSKILKTEGTEQVKKEEQTDKVGSFPEIGIDWVIVAILGISVVSVWLIRVSSRSLRKLMEADSITKEPPRKSWLEKRKAKKRKKIKQTAKRKQTVRELTKEAAKEEKKWKNNNLPK